MVRVGAQEALELQSRSPPSGKGWRAQADSCMVRVSGVVRVSESQCNGSAGHVGDVIVLGS